MGICLDTEQNNDGSQAFEESQSTWVQNSPNNRQNQSVTPPAGKFSMHNNTNVKFEAPKVPVIFILGGPGSGKVTHCDSLMQEKQGVTHINMTDLLQQYAIGNDMQDFGLLSSKTVTEVLMLEMKMSPNAKTYLISGYPRNMRDVVEYSEKIQTVNGVILISWRQKVLEKQIDYGAKLGQVVLSLARMELNNFYKNVMPVADYFDQSNMLISINGERHPQDVYKDFRAAVIKILGMQDNPPILVNGKAADVPTDVASELPTLPPQSGPLMAEKEEERPKTRVIAVEQQQPAYQSPVKAGWPPVLWVIGGPGSNKAALCAKVAKDAGWAHISLGGLLRAAAQPQDTRPTPEVVRVRDCITNGEMVPLDIVMRYVEAQMAATAEAPGVLLDGFPRDMAQASEFETKFKQKPTIILLDCSKLQLGRGRLDDSVTAFRKRLETFRQSSLPMLKTMDNIGRLTIVDGDTEAAAVQEDFSNVVHEHIEYLKQNQNDASGQTTNNHMSARNEQLLHDLEAQEEELNRKSVPNGVANGIKQAVNGFANGHVPNVANGYAGTLPKYTNRDDNVRQMYNEVNYMDGHM